ncbi:Methyltransferase OMS1 [Paramyrothecium foliicola]|nr:Methyltransferase OMS1 [Paramyrothecium foliicola]
MTIAMRAFARAAARSQQLRLASSFAKAPRKPANAPPTAKTLPPRVRQAYKPSSKPANSHISRPAPPPNEPETVLSIWRRSWLPLSGAALLSGFLGFYIFGTVAASFKDGGGGPCASCGGEHATPTGRPPALSGDNAEQFDKDLNWEEWWMGITGLRKKLAKRARGDVLELAMGTGRNLEYYDWEALGAVAAAAGGNGSPTLPVGRGITSFTGLDISVDMLDVARKKLVKAVPPMSTSAPVVKASTMADHTGGQLSYLNGQLRFIHSDAHRPIPLPASPVTLENPRPTPLQTKYDTVIQTFGLCSVSDPVAVLTNLATVVKPETGRIILLEHGKGWYGILNGLLDKNAGKHFEKFGCWWNRDIPALVDEAVKQAPGLEVVKVERPNILQMGTLVWVELKVSGKA